MAMKDLQLRRLKPRDRVYKRGDEQGLYVEVHPNGSKLWRLKYPYLGRDERSSNDFACLAGVRIYSSLGIGASSVPLGLILLLSSTVLVVLVIGHHFVSRLET